MVAKAIEGSFKKYFRRVDEIGKPLYASTLDNVKMFAEDVKKFAEDHSVGVAI